MKGIKRKKNCFFVMLLCFCCNIYAQPSRLFRHELSESISHTSTCWIDDETYITSASHHGSMISRISIVNEERVCREVVLNDIFVSDLTIDNDTLFFCGRGGNSIRGIIGYANIEELFYGSGTYTLYDDFISNPNVVISEFDKLVSYISSSGQRHIVCIADNLYMVDFIPQSTQYYNFLTASLQGFTLTESFQDIVYLPGNIIIASMDYTYNQPTKLVLRVFDSDNPITPSMNTVKHVFAQISDRNILHKRCVLAAIPSLDMVALMCHTDKQPIGNEQFEVYQSFISLSLFNPWALWDTTHVNSYAMLSTIECEQDNYQQQLLPLHLNWNDATQELIAINGLDFFSMSSPELLWNFRGNNLFTIPFSHFINGGTVDNFSLEGTLFQRASFNPSGLRFVTHGPHATGSAEFFTAKYFTGNLPLSSHCLFSESMYFNTKPTSSTSSTVQKLATSGGRTKGSARQADFFDSQMEPECEE